MIEQQTNNEHQIHIDVLPTDKFKTTMITFKFMAHTYIVLSQNLKINTLSLSR